MQKNENKERFRSITVADLAFPPRSGGYAKGHETRELILHAALGILVEEGFRAMSMRRVAAACNMKLGNLTYHFPAREDLVRELLDAVISSYEVEFAEIVHMPGVPPEERLAEICGLVLEDIRSRKTTHFFPELWALSNHDPFVSDRMQELYARARAPLVEIVAEMRPDLGIQDREDVALFISASMEGTTIFAGHAKPFEPRMVALEAIAIRSFIDLVRNYQPKRETDGGA
jgi:AcrR family transcriptional regulator